MSFQHQESFESLIKLVSLSAEKSFQLLPVVNFRSSIRNQETTGNLEIGN